MFTSAHDSLVQNDTEKSRVDLQAAVVLDESELSSDGTPQRRGWSLGWCVKFEGSRCVTSVEPANLTTEYNG